MVEAFLLISDRLGRVAATGGRLTGLVVLPSLIIVTVADVVGRQFFRIASSLLQDLEWHLFFAIVLLGLGWAYVEDGHVRIDIFRGHVTEQTRSWIEIIGCLLFMAPYCIIVIWYGLEFSWQSFVQGERSRAALGLPYRWIIKSVVPLGMLLLLAAGVSVLLRNVASLLSSRAASRRP